MGETPLHCAAMRGHVQCVRALIDAPAETDPRNNEGETPLFLAASWGHLDCAKTLLQNGADPLAPSNVRPAVSRGPLARFFGSPGRAERAR